MKIIQIEKKPPVQMTIKDLLKYVRDLETENARLEESFQKATGAVAADARRDEEGQRDVQHDQVQEVHLF